MISIPYIHQLVLWILSPKTDLESNHFWLFLLLKTLLQATHMHIFVVTVITTNLVAENKVIFFHSSRGQKS